MMISPSIFLSSSQTCIFPFSHLTRPVFTPSVATLPSPLFLVTSIWEGKKTITNHNYLNTQRANRETRKTSMRTLRILYGTLSKPQTFIPLPALSLLNAEYLVLLLLVPFSVVTCWKKINNENRDSRRSFFYVCTPPRLAFNRALYNGVYLFSYLSLV